MSNDTQLPPCRLCGQPPVIVEWLTYAETLVYCASPGCGLREDRMTVDEWRILHGPRLAPEHVEYLKWCIEGEPDDEFTRAIRAALTALGEDGR